MASTAASVSHHDRVDAEGFRLRGREVNRLEAFSDVVFGFALTLVGISLEVPNTFSDLAQRLRGLPAFAVCFAILVWIWHEHYRFFRRYDLQDTFTVTVNAVLLGLVLTYVYPLKFVFSMATAGQGRIEPAQVPELMILYGAGFAAVWAIYTVMYAHAWRLRHQLDLNRAERFETLHLLWKAVLQMSVGLLAIVVALIVAHTAGPEAAGLTGYTYVLLGPFITAFEFAVARKRRQAVPR